jgi:hypothetical protein
MLLWSKLHLGGWPVNSSRTRILLVTHLPPLRRQRIQRLTKQHQPTPPTSHPPTNIRIIFLVRSPHVHAPAPTPWHTIPRFLSLGLFVSFNTCPHHKLTAKYALTSNAFHIDRAMGGRVLGLYGPPFAGRPMGPKGPINFYWLA